MFPKIATLYHVSGPPASSRYRDDLDNNYDDDDSNPGSLFATESTGQQEEEEQTQPPAPKPFRCNLKPNVKNSIIFKAFHSTGPWPISQISKNRAVKCC